MPIPLPDKPLQALNYLSFLVALLQTVLRSAELTLVLDVEVRYSSVPERNGSVLFGAGTVRFCSFLFFFVLFRSFSFFFGSKVRYGSVLFCSFWCRDVPAPFSAVPYEEQRQVIHDLKNPYKKARHLGYLPTMHGSSVTLPACRSPEAATFRSSISNGRARPICKPLRSR